MSVDVFMKKNRNLFTQLSQNFGISMKEKAEIFGRLFRACRGKHVAVIISAIVFVWGIGKESNSKNEIFVRSSLLPDYLED